MHACPHLRAQEVPAVVQPLQDPARAGPLPALKRQAGHVVAPSWRGQQAAAALPMRQAAHRLRGPPGRGVREAGGAGEGRGEVGGRIAAQCTPALQCCVPRTNSDQLSRGMCCHRRGETPPALGHPQCYQAMPISSRPATARTCMLNAHPTKLAFGGALGGSSSRQRCSRSADGQATPAQPLPVRWLRSTSVPGRPLGGGVVWPPCQRCSRVAAATSTLQLRAVSTAAGKRQMQCVDWHAGKRSAAGRAPGTK